MAEKPATRKLEALLTLAKNDLGSRRKSPWRWVISGAIVFALIGVFCWSVGTPRGSPRPFLVMACDAIALPDEPVSLTGKIETVDDPNDLQELNRTPLVFQETVNNRQQTETCDALGIARIEASFSSSVLPLTWFVRYPGSTRRPPAQAKGVVYVRPQATPWLIVDADHVLPALSEQEFWRRDGIDVALMPGSLAALREAQKLKEIVYVATSADTASKHLRLKAWLARGWAPASQQPPHGPLLTPAASPSGISSQAFLQGVVTDLQKRYTPPLVALAARPEEAKVFIDAGVRTILLGDDDGAPPGAIVLKSWSDKLAEKIEGATR
jgi:hypothetical protein